MFLLWPTIILVFCGLPYYFSSILRAASASVYTARCACVAQVRLQLSFFKLTYMWSKAGHETCSSSWSGDRNFMFFLKIYLIFFLVQPLPNIIGYRIVFSVVRLHMLWHTAKVLSAIVLDYAGSWANRL